MTKNRIIGILVGLISVFSAIAFYLWLSGEWENFVRNY